MKLILSYYKPIVIYGAFMLLSRAELKALIEIHSVKVYKRCRRAGNARYKHKQD